MVGQRKLLDKLETFNLDNFPRSVFLLGEKGCGKHTYLNLIKDKLNLPLFDITDVVDFDYILNMYNRSTLTLYYLDIDNFTEKKQNVILKLLEEPPANAYLVIICSDKSLVLPTIINRCIVYEFEKYTTEELKTFIESGDVSSLMCEIFSTPGQILSSNTDVLKSLYELCEKIVDKIQLASYANAITISDKINYNDEYDKFDLVSFFKMMNHLILERYIKTSDKKLLDYLYITNDYSRKFSQDKRLDKKRLFENYIGKLWITSRCN